MFQNLHSTVYTATFEPGRCFVHKVGGKWLDLAAVVGHPKISQNVGCGGGSMSGWVSLYIFTYYMHLFAWKIHGPFCPLLLNCGVLMESGYWCSSHQLMQEFSPSVRMNYDGTKSQAKKVFPWWVMFWNGVNLYTPSLGWLLYLYLSTWHIKKT